MPALAPKRLLSELATEAMVGRYRLLVVEGPSDREFIQTWSDEGAIRLTAVEVDELDLAGLYPGEGEWGNRDRVRAVSKQLLPDDEVRCLIDRDLDGRDADESEPLLLTDFPGLESYCLTTETVRRLTNLVQRNEASLGSPEDRRLTTVREMNRLANELADWFIPLFCLRSEHRIRSLDMEFPKDLRKYRSKGEDGPDLEKLRLALGLQNFEIEFSGLRSDFRIEDLRPYAYGHDVARVLFTIWPDIRQRTGIKDPKQLERTMLSLVSCESIGTSNLFVYLKAWCARAQ